MLNTILFLTGCSFISVCAFIINLKENRENKPSINTGEEIGFEDYIYIDYWEVRYMEPFIVERVADLQEFKAIQN